MRLEMYAFYDMRVGVYTAPTVLRSRGEATRVMQDLANKKDHPFGQHPVDYAMYFVGYYEDTDGEMVPAPHELVGKLIDFVEDDGLPFSPEEIARLNG